MRNGFINLFGFAGLAAGALLLQTPTSLEGQAPPANVGQHLAHVFQFVANYLDLTEAQKVQAQQIMADGRAQAAPLIAELKSGHGSVAEAVKAGDNATIDKLTAAQGVLMGRLAAVHAKSMAKFYAILTPDQQAKADKLRDNIRQMVGARFPGLGGLAP
jgi:Spy/CpxP family protein refolding chaperone